jgi:hypothetical protein
VTNLVFLARSRSFRASPGIPAAFLAACSGWSCAAGLLALRDAPRSESAVSIASRISGLPVGSSKDRRLHDFMVSRINEAAQVVSQIDGTVRLFGRAGKTAEPHPMTNLARRGDLRLDLGAGPAVSDKPSYFNG